MAFVPLSSRDDDDRIAKVEALYGGVPEWMHPSLFEWLTTNLCAYDGSIHRDRLRAMERALQVAAPWDGDNEYSGARLVMKWIGAKTDLMLDVTDYLVALSSSSDGYDIEQRLPALMNLLRESGSEWTVGSLGDSLRLVRRVDETVRESAEQAMTLPRAGVLLARAWSGVFGRDPDPSDAYRQAVRAVEAVAGPVVLPNDAGATLGKVIGHLRATKDRWSIDFTHGEPGRPVGVLIEMLSLLWGSQHDRHISPDSDAPLFAGQQEAENAVVLAATLVHWFSSGAVSQV
jgi:hypothetical protein